MITIIEEELLKIITPVLQKTDLPVDVFIDSRINMDIIVSREKINLINNIKIFIKANLTNPSLSIIFTKHISIVFSKILFKCLDDVDQNVRIASDECINLIIRLTNFNFSPYIIYNLFIEIKSNQSSRSLNGALQKFAALSPLIKNSKRMSYINNVLPVLKVILHRSEESVLLTLVETLPKIASNLFPYASDADIEKAVIVTLIKCLQATSVVSNQRNYSQLISISCSHMKNRKFYIEKLFSFFVSVDFGEQNENEVRGSLFVLKSLIVLCHTEPPLADLDELVLVLWRLIQVLDGNASASVKNLSLDCLLQLLQLGRSSVLWSCLHSSGSDKYEKMLAVIEHDAIFEWHDDDEDDETATAGAGEDGKNSSERPGRVPELEESTPDSLLLTGTASLGDEQQELLGSPLEHMFVEESHEASYDADGLMGEYGGEEPFGDNTELLVEANKASYEDALDEPFVLTGDRDETVSKVGELGTLTSWTAATIGYLVKMLIVEFLPESIPMDWPLPISRQKKVRINSKVLAINCLTQICRMDCRMVLDGVSILEGTYRLPSALNCVLKYCTDEDSQLSGSAILLLAQVFRSHFTQSNHADKPLEPQSPNTTINCRQLIETIQCQINNPISGQHLKSVLSALKWFLADLITSEFGDMATDICESILRYTDHNYKLVRKELLLICQVVDFRNMKLLFSDERSFDVIKKTSLADKFINAVLNLLADVEQDIRDDACESLQYLIANGAFDRDNLFCECSCALHSDSHSSSMTDKSRLIPFLHLDINVSLSNIRKKLQHNCSHHNSQSTVHRAVHLIIKQLLSNPVSSTKEMKLSINEISGCIHALLVLHEKYPISTHPKVWIGQNINDNTSLTETKTLIGYCLSLLNTSLIISDICLHNDLLCLISKLIFHGGIKHLLLNNLVTEQSNPETGINTQLNDNLYLVSSIKQFMVHICRIMNIYWHIFQFITPSIPPHKTVLPNLSSQTHVSPAKKKVDAAPQKGSSDSSSTDFRPPRTKSSLGFFVNEPNYMLIHRVFSGAYNSYIISFDSSSQTDRLLNLLTQCLNSLGSIFEFLTFSEVSMHIEELLSYCSVFYNILPTPTVTLIIKLLGSLFGTNLTAQWDPFLAQLFHQLFASDNSHVNQPDLVLHIMETWKNECIKNGTNLQTQLKGISTSNDGNDTLQIYKGKQALSDTFLWIKASGKRREPGILRQIASTNSLHRPSLGHYIGLFEKHVFQCMRQYLVSSTELQTSIIDLLCQLIYLRVNYCQLDSEQKFLNIIQNQLENFTAYNIDDGRDSSLIIEITEFLVLISYEKAAGNKKDQPILNITQVIRCVESLLVNGINVKSVIISCMWKIVCDLFVHRAVWMNNPGNFNLFPNANTSKEIEAQREAIIEFLLRKLIKYPETLEILALIVEHSARQQELKWQKLSSHIWNRLSSVLLEDSIEFSSTAHIDHLQRLFHLLSVKVMTQPTIGKSIVELALKFDDTRSINQDIYSAEIIQNYRLHVIQAVRSVICLQTIFMHDLDYCRDFVSSDLLNDTNNDAAMKQEFYHRIINIFKLILEFYSYTMNNQYLQDTIDQEYTPMARKLIKMMLLIFIDIRILDHSNVDNLSEKEKIKDTISTLNNQFLHLHDSDLDLMLLWNEIKLTCDLASNISLTISNKSPLTTRNLRCNHVLQCCREIIKDNGPLIEVFIKSLITNHYIILVQLSKYRGVMELVDLVNRNEQLSCHLLYVFKEYSNQITCNTSILIKWLQMIESINFLASSKMISLLTECFISRAHDFSAIVLMKVESILCSRIDMIMGAKFEVSSNLPVIEIIKSIGTFIENSVVPMSRLKDKIKITENIHEKYIISLKPMSPVLDPLNVDKGEADEVNEKKFWKVCVEKSLKNHDQDIRLGPRLLQGGSANDLEQLFCVRIASDEPRTLLSSKSVMKDDIDEVISNLPPRFAQQCLRLGFLRSGGGNVQEGVRVDLIFRLGEKLMFEELRYVLEKMKDGLKNEYFNFASPAVVVGLLAAINDYLSLSCQLSVPLPVSNDASEKIVDLIECLSISITKSDNFRSRLLEEELLTLITVCYGSSSLLTDEGVKFMGSNLTLSNVSIIVDFLFLLVNQFSSNKLRGSMKYSLKLSDKLESPVKAIVILDKILKCYYSGQLEDNDVQFHKKLKTAVIAIARLPCVVTYTRNAKNIKDLDLAELEKNVHCLSYKNIVELDCLSKLNRDDLAAAQTILNNLGWTSRFMFEESWLLFLNLLHDKGPSGGLADKTKVRLNLSPEEVVEQGHCDSLGLLGLTDMLLQTTARPNPGNPVVAQLEHKPRDKTPNLLHTKTGRKLCVIHAQLEEEIFLCHRGFKMLSGGWTITSWNLEREDSVLKYRHDQININVLAKRISIGSRSPQISGSNSNNLDVLSCLQSLPIICQQWLETINDNTKRVSVALWPRACALRSAVMLMDLFSSREQVQWLLDSLLELYKSLTVEDDWITTSWICIGLSKCVAVLETSSNAVLPQNTISGKPPNAVTTNSVYGLAQAMKLIESCLHSDLTILQQSALHSSMCLLQMMIYGKYSWDLPAGSLMELRNLHDMVMHYLENQLLIIDCYNNNNDRRSSLSDTSNLNTSVINSNAISQVMSSGAASIANTMSGFTSINSVNAQLILMNPGASNSLGHFSPNSLPRLLKSNQGISLRSERHNYLIMATACFYCERYPDALSESDILNNFVTLTKTIMQLEMKKDTSPQLILTICRCLERISLTQRVSNIVTEQIIRICGIYLKTCKSSTHTLPVLGLFLTSCYLSLANSTLANPSQAAFESVFYNGPANGNGENQLVMLERINLFWKRLTDADTMDVVETRILSRLISSIMTEFMSGEELLNKTIHQLLRSWPRSQCVAKTLFDVIIKCLNQPDGEKLIRKWTLLVLQSLTSCRPDNLSIWATTIVLVASGSSSRGCLRALFSQCLDWLTRFERGEHNMAELELTLCLAALAFLQDIARDSGTENDNKIIFLRAMQSSSNIPAFQKFLSIAREKHLL